MVVSCLADREAGLRPDRKFVRFDLGNSISLCHAGESAASFVRLPATDCAHAAAAGLAQVPELFMFGRPGAVRSKFFRPLGTKPVPPRN
jgi:hypothetical protein